MTRNRSNTDSPAAQVLNSQQAALPPKADERSAIPDAPAAHANRDVGPHSGTGNAAKVDRLNAIADQLDAERTAEGLDIDPGEAPAKVAAPVEEPDADEPAAAAPEGDEPAKVETAPVVDDPDLTLKVNGRDVTKKRSVWLIDAAKVESADQYLQSSKEAARIALAGGPSKDAPPPKSKDLRPLARAIQMGTEDEAEQALRQLIEGQSSETPDIAKLVDQRLSLHEQKSKFDDEFKVELSDPDLRALILAKDEALLVSNPEMTNLDRWRKAGGEVREMVKRLAPPAPTPNPTLDKSARKALVAAVPSAAGRQNTAKDDEAEDDPVSVIEKMAKARGQGRSVQH